MARETSFSCLVRTFRLPPGHRVRLPLHTRTGTSPLQMPYSGFATCSISSDTSFLVSMFAIWADNYDGFVRTPTRPYRNRVGVHAGRRLRLTARLTREVST